MKHSRPQPPFLRSLRRLRMAFWRRRVARWLVRAAWLALLVPTIFLAGYLWGGWQVRWYDWAYPMLLVGLLSLLWSMRPISLKKIVYRLDHRLGLRAQLVTAFEVSHRSKGAAQAQNLVVQRLLRATVDIVAGLRRQVRFFNRALWLELQALLGVAALLSALLMLDALTPRLPNATPVELPPAGQEPAADEVIPPEAQLFPPPFQPEMQAQALNPDQVQAALQALAEALRDQAVTRSIAEAIDRGDLGSAAEGLRRLADQLGDLSEQAQSEVGQALQEAADNIGQAVPNLTDPLQAGSQALAQDNLGQARQALTDLAEALDAIQQAPQESAQAEPNPDSQSTASDQSQAAPEQEPAAEPGDNSGAGAGQGEGQGSEQPTEEERLAIEGEPLELESDPEALGDEHVLQPAELGAQAGDKRTEDSPFARQPLNTTTDLGPDPLTYPWEKREIIRRYFTP